MKGFGRFRYGARGGAGGVVRWSDIALAGHCLQQVRKRKAAPQHSKSALTLLNTTICMAALRGHHHMVPVQNMIRFYDKMFKFQKFETLPPSSGGGGHVSWIAGVAIDVAVALISITLSKSALPVLCVQDPVKQLKLKPVYILNI